MPKVVLQAAIDTEEIIRSLTELSQEEILEVLVELDDTIGDWDFTRLVYERFHKEIAYLDREQGGGWH
jgi:hypothetical protein